MKYGEIEVGEIQGSKDYEDAILLLAEEFPDHRDTNLFYQYEFLLIAKKSNEVIGMITANKYLPKKALLCDIVVEEKYRSAGVGIKLLKEMGIYLRDRGHTHLMGFTPKKNKEALNTYKRVHTHQEEMIVTTSELNISIPHIEQMEEVLIHRENRRETRQKKGNTKKSNKGMGMSESG
jgi:GNAT superfamily N-acetyltransferase